MTTSSAAPAADVTYRKFRWLLLAVIVVWFGVPAIFPRMFWVLGVNHFGIWFLDSLAILASNDAVVRGLNPFALNPLDPFHRPHVYSHWWLQLRHLGLTRDANIGVGVAMALAFFAAALSRLKPRSRGELAWYWFVLGSPAILLAINRANNDLVV